jgi:hypothetical protein
MTIAYVLILLVLGDHGMAVGTSQAVFADHTACETAGQAAAQAGGSYSWSTGSSMGWGPRVSYTCKPQSSPAPEKEGGR